jgi:hypothetical protein
LLELRKYQSFEYRLDGNHILVDGDVGKTKATFLIDTGAHGGVLNLEFSKRASLEIGPMDQQIHGIAGSAPAAITKVPLLKLGDVLVKDRDLLSADIYKDLPVVGGRGTHDAIFGADFLRELDAVISYKEGRMFLRPDASDKEDAAKPEEKKEQDAAGRRPMSGMSRSDIALRRKPKGCAGEGEQTADRRVDRRVSSFRYRLVSHTPLCQHFDDHERETIQFWERRRLIYNACAHLYRSYWLPR